MPPARPRPRTALGVGAVVVALASVTGCTEDAAPPPPAPPTTVPLGDIDLSSMGVARAPFCEALDESAVSDALGGEPRRTGSWESGDRRRVGEERDVVHEAGCSYRRRGVEATAWVFAQPLNRSEARALLAQRRKVPDCERAGELAFGRPGAVHACEEGETRRVTMAGLFGDAWLTCELSSPADEPRAEVLERAQRWCVEVVYAATPA